MASVPSFERTPSMSRTPLFRLTTSLLFLLLSTVSLLASNPGKGFSAAKHQAKGIGCADCHGKAKKKTAVAAERCLECHGPAAEVAKRTAAVKPENPHDSPHWGSQMDCTVCHRQHEVTVNWCNNCHAFGFKVP